jgi:hypothetical protein
LPAGSWEAAEHALRRLELACTAPLAAAARKRRRLAVFGLARLGDVPSADIQFDPGTAQCLPACADLIAAERRYLAKYVCSDGKRPRFGALWREVPAIIDLHLYPDFAAYAARLRRHSKGGVLRQIRKARAQGFVCRTIYSGFYRRQRFAIDTSKWFRSGLVLASLVRRPPGSDFPDGVSGADIAAYLGRAPSEIAEGSPLPEPPPTACPHHWAIDWGVFATEDREAADGRKTPHERLVGYVFLRRTGNIVRTAGLMGHGAYLSQNVMKLLFHDVLDWLLSQADPRVEGLRYLQYGAIEHGNQGLFAWKRSFEFAPARLRWRRS